MIISHILRNISYSRSFQYLSHIDLHAINTAFHEFNTSIFLHQLKISELEAKVIHLESKLTTKTSESSHNNNHNNHNNHNSVAAENTKLEDEMLQYIALHH